MKPSWNDAPEWANYLAMDEDGQWSWYEKRPEMRSGFFLWSSGKAEAASPALDWSKSLERRPSN